MNTFVIAFLIVFVAFPLLILFIKSKGKKYPTEGMRTYYRIIDDINLGVDEEDIKYFLMKRYKLQSHESSLLISMARLGQDEYVETLINIKANG